MAKAAKGKEKEVKQEVELQPLDLRRTKITLKGQNLLCNRFSPSKKAKMLATQTGEANVGREKRDPKADFEGSLYTLPKKVGRCKYGFPSSAFKKAGVTAAGRFMDGAKMTHMRGAFHIVGDMVPIKCTDGPVMHEATVRNKNGSADFRFRGLFPTWEVELEIEYNARAITLDQLVHSYELAGFGVGVGDWRPEKDGSFGRWEVKR